MSPAPPFKFEVIFLVLLAKVQRQQIRPALAVRETLVFGPVTLIWAGEPTLQEVR